MVYRWRDLLYTGAMGLLALGLKPKDPGAVWIACFILYGLLMAIWGMDCLGRHK